MIPRVRSASIALLAVLAVASPCLAGEGMGPGRGAIGGQFGGSFFWADGDYSEGAKSRLAFSGHYRYVMNHRFRWQISPGFTWTGYSGAVPAPVQDVHFPQDVRKRTNLTLLLPTSFELQCLIHTGKWHYHIGAGPGAYRVWIENRRRPLLDPVSFRKHQGLYPGVTGEVGVERFIKTLPSTSVEACVTTHWVFTPSDAVPAAAGKPPPTFPSGYNSFLAVTEIRIGANYYFDMSRLRRKSTALPPTSRR
jgi:hypothetical protein